MQIFNDSHHNDIPDDDSEAYSTIHSSGFMVKWDVCRRRSGKMLLFNG
jgi:hypothetical protein